jgi:hypothetical protein
VNDGGYDKDMLFIRLDGPTPFVTILYRQAICKFYSHSESPVFIPLKRIFNRRNEIICNGLRKQYDTFHVSDIVTRLGKNF